MAGRTALGVIDSSTRDWIQRASDEYLRRHGRYRELVLRMLAPSEELTDEGNGFTTRVVRARRRIEPTREELAAALSEAPDEPIPRVLLDYVIKRYVLETHPQKTGPKTPIRSTKQTIEILAFYRRQLRKAEARRSAGLTSSPAERAKQRTTAKFGISTSTLEHLLTADRQRLTAIKSSKK